MSLKVLIVLSATGFVQSIYLGASWGTVLFSFGSALFLTSLFAGRSFADNGGKMLTGSPNFRLLWNKFCDSLTLNCTQMKFLNGMYVTNYTQKTSSIDKYVWMFNNIRKHTTICMDLWDLPGLGQILRSTIFIVKIS